MTAIFICNAASAAAGRISGNQPAWDLLTLVGQGDPVTPLLSVGDGVHSRTGSVSEAEHHMIALADVAVLITIASCGRIDTDKMADLFGYIATRMKTGGVGTERRS